MSDITKALVISHDKSVTEQEVELDGTNGLSQKLSVVVQCFERTVINICKITKNNCNVSNFQEIFNISF